MTKTYCDKCGKESTNRIVVDLPCEKIWATHQAMGIWIKSYDLCINCFNELKKWIDEDE